VLDAGSTLTFFAIYVKQHFCYQVLSLLLCCIITKDAPIIGIGRLSAVLPIVVYTIGKYKFIKFLLPEVNKHKSDFLFW